MGASQNSAMRMRATSMRKRTPTGGKNVVKGMGAKAGNGATQTACSASMMKQAGMSGCRC